MAAPLLVQPAAISECGQTFVRRTRPLLAPHSRLADLVLVLFLLAQCLDGVLTYIGVLSFGLEIEANPLIAALMVQLGEGTALVGAKVVAAVLGIALHLRQVHGAIAVLTAFYFAVAIAPWTAILFL